MLGNQWELSLSGLGNAASVQTGGLAGTAHNSLPYKTQKNQEPGRIFLPVQPMMDRGEAGASCTSAVQPAQALSLMLLAEH